jgi:predicted Zn-dependent protease
VHDINDLERRGIPGVFVATAEFADAAIDQSRSLGLDVAHVLTEHPIQDRTDEEMVAIADQAIEALLGSLTGPT